MPSRPKDAKGREKKNELAWMVSFSFTEKQAMQDWGCLPQEWRRQPKADRISMMAMTRVKSNMEAADNSIMNSRMDKARRDAGDGNKGRGTKRLR